MFQVQRIYAFRADAPAFAVFVDRLYPRGIRKELFARCLWLKSVCPSDELRRWLHQDVRTNYAEFVIRYELELQSDEAQAGLNQLKTLEAQHGDVLLLTAVKDTEHSHIPVLLKYLRCQNA